MDEKAKKRNQTKRREWFNFNKAIALLLILALFIILKTAFTSQKTQLTEEAEIVLNTLTDGNAEISLVDSNGLVENKVRDLDNMDYDEIKNIIGIKNDFCIFFEDTTGNIIKIDDINLGIGSNKIRINGDPCK